AAGGGAVRAARRGRTRRRVAGAARAARRAGPASRGGQGGRQRGDPGRAADRADHVRGGDRAPGGRAPRVRPRRRQRSTQREGGVVTLRVLFLTQYFPPEIAAAP